MRGKSCSEKQNKTKTQQLKGNPQKGSPTQKKRSLLHKLKLVYSVKVKSFGQLILSKDPIKEVMRSMEEKGFQRKKFITYRRMKI